MLAMGTVLLLNDTSEEPHWGCEAAGGEILSALSSLRGIAGIQRYSVHYSWQFKPCPVNLHDAIMILDKGGGALDDLRKTIAASRFVVVNGEGTLLGSRPPVRNLLLFLLIAAQLGIPFAIVNATIDPERMQGSRDEGIGTLELYRAVLPRACLVTVREARSYHACRQLGAINVWHAYDASLPRFARKLATTAPTTLTPATCIVFGSVKLNGHRRDRLLAFLKQVREVAACSFVFCSMSRSEAKLLKSLSEEFSAPLVDAASQPLESVIGLLEQASFVISGRYHGCLLSAAQGIPFMHYETHSPRIVDFCRHLCYEWGRLYLFGQNRSADNLETLDHMLRERTRIREFLLVSLPHLVIKAGIHRREITITWNELVLNSTSLRQSQESNGVPFIARNKVAAEMLPKGLRVLDLGGYTQAFGSCYAFKAYTSIDLLSAASVAPMGQPRVVPTARVSLPFPDSHIEADIDEIRDFRFAGEFDVVVMLGLFPWLRNWQRTLNWLSMSGIKMCLVSWDGIELDRVAAYLSRLGYWETKRVDISRKSSISLLERE